MSAFLQETFSAFPDFALLDTGDGLRLEQWGPFRLSRPDPQIIWDRHLAPDEWRKTDAQFEGTGERGRWTVAKQLPESWPVTYQLPIAKQHVTLKARLTPFKHTGIFAEQAANWEWMEKLLQGKRERKILNLFGYTGAASMILTILGQQVTHVDASKPAIGWAKENQQVNKLPKDSIRWILDDAAKFVAREVKRGQQYDGIIMDPPAFGHSPDGKTWRFNKDLPGLLRDCVSLLSDDADFLLINGYATNSSAIALQNILEDAMKHKPGKKEHGELCLKQQDGRLISTGIFARWSHI